MELSRFMYQWCVGVIVLSFSAGCVAIQPSQSTPLPTATLAPAADNTNPPMPEINPSSNVAVFASGLDNPRGLKFGPDGHLYVAEGGQGGALRTTITDCAQVLPPVGPYTGEMTARVSKIDAQFEEEWHAYLRQAYPQPENEPTILPTAAEHP